MNEKRWRRRVDTDPSTRLSAISQDGRDSFYSPANIYIPPSGDSKWRRNLSSIFVYNRRVYQFIYGELSIGEGEGGKIIRESARSSDRYIYIYFSLLSFSFFLIPSLFTRETHFPLSSSNDRVGKLVIFRSSQFRPSFEMCWLMKKRGHR